MNEKTSIIITGMICISLLETIALLKGINGVLLTSVIAVLAGLVGWTQKTPKILETNERGY